MVNGITAKATDTNVLTLKIPVHSLRDYCQWFLIRSDVHHDNAKCDQALERRHLEQAKERKALVLDFGDYFCAMQGKYDPRSDLSALRPEYKNGRYLDSLVNEAAAFNEPYKDHMLLWGLGNHETAILGRHQTNLTERMVALLNSKGAESFVGGYAGFVEFKFMQSGRPAGSCSLHYFHGAGGSAPVTKGMIGANRHRSWAMADIYCSGHDHNQWADKSTVLLEVNPMGKVQRRPITYIKTGTYKDEFDKGLGGWAVEKGIGPKPLGAYWLKFIYDGDRGLKWITEETI